MERFYICCGGFSRIGLSQEDMLLIYYTFSCFFLTVLVKIKHLQAMDMMKFTTSTPFSPKNTGYQNFFEAFVDNKSNYPLKEVEIQEGAAVNQVIPYIIFLVSPIFALVLIVVQKKM